MVGKNNVWQRVFRKVSITFWAAPRRERERETDMVVGVLVHTRTRVNDRTHRHMCGVRKDVGRDGVQGDGRGVCLCNTLIYAVAEL